MSANAGVRLAELQRTLALFAQGMAGRALVLSTDESAPDDTARLRLPPLIADFASARDNRGAYRVTVLRQIGALDSRALDFAALGVPSPSTLLRRLFATLESLRIDAAIARQCPGARADLVRMRQLGLSRRPSRSGQRALAGLRRFALGASADDVLAHDGSGLLAAWLVAAATLQQADATAHDSAVIALRLCAGPTSTDGAGAPPEAGIEGIEGAGLAAPGALPPEPVRTRRGASGAGATAMQPPLASTADAVDNTVQAAAAGLHVGQAAPPPSAAQAFLYDEWDHPHRRYLPAWCRLFEQRLRGDDVDFVAGVRRRHATLMRQVRRQFGAIRPEAWQRVHRSRDGDELELEGLIDSVIDRRRGLIGDDRVYLRRERAVRDVAAAFLVDLSASTDFPVPDPHAPAAAPPEPDAGDDDPYLYGGRAALAPTQAPPKRRVIDVAKDALAVMCDALQTLGDSHAVYGFSGEGRARVDFMVVKDFADRAGPRTAAALGAMQPRGATRMGPAIRHATAKLARQPQRIKLLVIVSDGYPQDSDYGPDRHDEDYGIQDTARALQEAEQAGVAPFCVTIDPAGHDYLRRMCSAHRYLVIDDMAALPRELSKLYRRLSARPDPRHWAGPR